MTLKEIVPDTSGFTASNGIPVTLTVDGRLIVENADHTYPATIAADEHVQALREFFRHEEDERLARWRWPENTDYVVYPLGLDADGFRYARVLLERTGASGTWQEGQRPSGALSHPDGLGILAAMAFFDAHPEPKPAWHDAKPGEVWVLTTHGEEQPYCRASNGWEIVGRSYFILGDYITAGRRIWPDEPKQVAS